MNSCEFVMLISSIACSIAKEKTQDELDILSAFFTQLGDTLASISAIETNCINKIKNNNVDDKIKDERKLKHRFYIQKSLSL